MNQASEIKNLLVLARRDPIEAMRVAAGLTIHDHQVQILFLCEADLGTEEAKEYLELLEFSEIVPKTILPSMGNQIECLDGLDASRLLEEADQTISLWKENNDCSSYILFWWKYWTGGDAENFEQKQDLTHLHLQHLKDDEDWDEALDLIIKADRIISIWDVFPYFESFNILILFYKDIMGLFQSP